MPSEGQKFIPTIVRKVKRHDYSASDGTVARRTLWEDTAHDCARCAVLRAVPGTRVDGWGDGCGMWWVAPPLLDGRPQDMCSS